MKDKKRRSGTVKNKERVFSQRLRCCEQLAVGAKGQAKSRLVIKLRKLLSDIVKEGRNLPCSRFQGYPDPMWRKRFQDLARNTGDQICSLTREFPNAVLKAPAEKFTWPEWYEQFRDFVGEQLPGPDILSRQTVDRWYSHENDLRTALAKLLMSSV